MLQFWLLALSLLTPIQGGIDSGLPMFMMGLQPTAEFMAKPDALEAGGSTNTHAIVQLKDLNLPQPQVSGHAQLSLQRLPNSRGVFTLPVMIGAQTGTFLLDTGASTTLMTADLRQQLGLRGSPVASDRLSYAVAGEDCPEMTATRLQAPPITLHNVLVLGLETLQFDQTLIPDGADGVLGMDVLGQFDLRLDPEQNQLFLEQPTPLTPSQRLQAIPLRIQSGVVLAQLWMNGQGPFEVLLDTAADSTFISPRVAQQLKLGDRQPIQMLGFCGLEAAERTQLARVTLGNNSQENMEAIITNSSVLTTLGIDGVLGQNFLNAYQQQWKSFGDKKWLILETAKSTKNEG